MPIPMPMPMSICPYQDFQMAISLDFVSFILKRRRALEMKNLHDYPDSLMHIRPFDKKI